MDKKKSRWTVEGEGKVTEAAVEAMLLVVQHNGPTMMARIGMMQALNRDVERVFNPDRKDNHGEKGN
jgi:hypothetical protein